MAKKRKRRESSVEHRSRILAIWAVVLCVAAALGLGWERVGVVLDDLFQAVGLVGAPADVEGDLKVHFIDVGQGDCTLIQTAAQTVLVDAGERGNEERVTGYLKAQQVKDLDLVIVTHPHTDHMGSLAGVLEAFPTEKVLFGQVPDNLTPTTKTYERLLDTIDAQDIPLEIAEPGTELEIGGGAEIHILGPGTNRADNLNDTSIVFRLEYGKTSFLFTGDAEKDREKQILKVTPPWELASDVLKLGHHGSRTSTCQEWLDAVNPDIAVALAGADNDYGHPHPETLERLEKAGVTLYRSDLNGNIVIGSDGETLSIQTSR